MGGIHGFSHEHGAHWEDWARGNSWLHRRDARAKILAALAMLVALSFTRHVGSATVPLTAWLLVIATGTAGLPMLALLVRAAAVLPFALTFALMSWLLGDPARAQMLLAKSFLSGWVAVLLMATTPLVLLMAGFDRLGVPTLVAEVILMLVRYLTVLGDRAASLRRAAASRGVAWFGIGTRTALFSNRLHRGAGAGMIATLFRDCMERATRIHQAMLARGYQGRFPVLKPGRWNSLDSLMVLGAAMAMVGSRWLP